MTLDFYFSLTFLQIVRSPSLALKSLLQTIEQNSVSGSRSSSGTWLFSIYHLRKRNDASGNEKALSPNFSTTHLYNFGQNVKKSLLPSCKCENQAVALGCNYPFGHLHP